MASNLDAPRELMTLVSFRVPPVVLEAMQEAAKKQFSSVSEVARQFLVAELRTRGLLD
jgi:hypothetical protein